MANGSTNIINIYKRNTHIDRLLCPDIVQFHSACLRTEIFLRELALSSTAEFKSEEFSLRRPAVFSQNAILCSLISRQIFLLFNDTHG